MVDIVSPQTAVQDFRNKSLAPMLRGTPGGVTDVTGNMRVAGPGLPVTVGGGGGYADRMADTAVASANANSRLMSTIAQRQRAVYDRQGRGTMGGATQAMTAAGMGQAGGMGGAYGLQRNAATALARLQAAYRAKWGSDLSVISGGRSHAEQQHLYDLYRSGRGNLAAKPGTSVHESGRAVDFGGAAHGFGPQQSWLAQVAAQYGFSWTGKSFKQVEPWHFEYVGS